MLVLVCGSPDDTICEFAFPCGMPFERILDISFNFLIPQGIISIDDVDSVIKEFKTKQENR